MTNTVSAKITDETLSRVIHIESAGKPDAKARTSSATGLGQFIDGTWMDVVTRHRPDLLKNRSKAQVLALRTNPTIAIEMLARFTEGNAAALGAGYTDGDLYLAHFAGVGTARKILRAPSSTPISDIVSEAAIKANPSILRGKTAGQVRVWANNKMAAADGKGWVAKWYKATGADRMAIIDGGGEPMDPIDDEVQGDPEVYAVQLSLRDMGYNPGGLDGEWGGLTSGALSGFLNDRDTELQAPTSERHFKSAYVDIKRELERAELESPPFTRPIAAKRASTTISDVEKTAPEVTPVRRNYLTAVWAFFASIGASLLAYIERAWNFFNDHQDSGWMSRALDYAGHVPAWVWLLGASGVIAFFAFNSLRGVQGITEAVNKGDRL